MLSTGRYLAIYPGSLLKLAAKRLSITVLPIKLNVPSNFVGIVTLKGRTISPVSRLFVDTAKEIVRNLRLRPA